MAAAQAADLGGAIKGPSAGQVGPDPLAIGTGPAPTGQANAGSAAALPSPDNLDLAAAPVSLPNGASPTGANSPAAGSAVPVPQAPRIQSLASAGGSTAARIPTAPAGNAGNARDAKFSGVTPPPLVASAAATSPADGNAQTPGNAAAVPGTDAAAQAVMAAAIAQGTSAPSPDSTSANANSPAADSTLTDAGPQGVAAPGAPLPGAPAALAKLSGESIAAATAAAAASVQAISSAAGVADKRSHGNGPDSALSGATNDGSAGAAQLLTSNASSTSAPTFKVAAGVDTAQFGQGVADRVSMMMDGNLTSAKLQVNPPALGPIEVRIALQGGHAQVWLSSHSAVTRDAFESSSPKLQEMLSSQGFSQVSVDISQRSFQERSPPSQAYEAHAHRRRCSRVGPRTVSMSRSASGLLDAYA